MTLKGGITLDIKVPVFIFFISAKSSVTDLIRSFHPEDNSRFLRKGLSFSNNLIIFAYSPRSESQIDKRLFGAYKSASGHHFKIKVPKKIYLFIGMVGLAAYLVYYVFSGFYGSTEPDTPKTATAQTTDKTTKPLSLGSVVNSATQSLKRDKSDKKEDQPMTKAQYLAYYEPRIEGLPHTAPAYDKLTEPQTYPKLSCMMTESKSFIKSNQGRIATKKINNVLTGCGCYTQQASIYHVPFAICQNIVENGYFDPAKPDPNTDHVLKGKELDTVATAKLTNVRLSSKSPVASLRSDN